MVENFTTEPYSSRNHLSMGISTTPDSLFCLSQKCVGILFSAQNDLSTDALALGIVKIQLTKGMGV